jgi:AP-3 complex subunit beta
MMFVVTFFYLMQIIYITNLFFKVVMAVVQLYYHVAPRPEVNIVVKALIRLLRSHTEVQAVVLSSIAAMSTTRQVLFILMSSIFHIYIHHAFKFTHIVLSSISIRVNF